MEGWEGDSLAPSALQALCVQHIKTLIVGLIVSLVYHSKKFFLERIGPIPVWREIGMGFFLTRGEASSKEKKIPHESQMAHFKLPMNGLAGLMK